MQSQSSISQWVPLATVIMSGLFSIVVVIVTALLISHRGEKEFKRDRERERYEEVKNLYVKHLAQLENAIRLTLHLESYLEHEKGLSLVNAQLLLIAPQSIFNQSELVSDLLYQWSSEYKAGSPKRVGDTNTAVSSINDKLHADKARELYPQLNNEVVKLRDQMTKHLDELRP